MKWYAGQVLPVTRREQRKQSGPPVRCSPLPCEKRAAGPRELSVALQGLKLGQFPRLHGRNRPAMGPIGRCSPFAEATLPHLRASVVRPRRTTNPKTAQITGAQHSSAAAAESRDNEAGRWFGLDIDSDVWWPAGRSSFRPLLGGAVNRHVLNAADLAAYE